MMPPWKTFMMQLITSRTLELQQHNAFKIDFSVCHANSVRENVMMDLHLSTRLKPNLSNIKLLINYWIQ